MARTGLGQRSRLAHRLSVDEFEDVQPGAGPNRPAHTAHGKIVHSRSKKVGVTVGPAQPDLSAVLALTVG